MGYRYHADAMATTRLGSAHGAALGLSHGRRAVRNADELCQGRCDLGRRRSSPDGRRSAHLQAAYSAWLHPVLGFAVHAHDPHLERCRSALLSVPALSDCPHAANTGEGTRAVVSISVNGVDVTAGPETTSELRAARELLRQRAVAVG